MTCNMNSFCPLRSWGSAVVESSFSDPYDICCHMRGGKSKDVFIVTRLLKRSTNGEVGGGAVGPLSTLSIVIVDCVCSL